MITSAGCNALDYLIHDPASIDCVDVNPNQNALLELKLAALKALRYPDFFDMSGEGCIYDQRYIYFDMLRHRLTSEAQAIWDKRIVARSLYFYMNTCRGMGADLHEFQFIRDLDEQAEFYRTRIAPKL